MNLNEEMIARPSTSVDTLTSTAAAAVVGEPIEEKLPTQL